jgi:alpha-L-fucosidase
VRWIGNETGVAGDTNWSMVDPGVVPVPGMSGNEVMRMLREGDPAGTVWRPGETDVSIRPGWFYHPAEDERVKSVDRLVEIYFTSVGRNSKLLLNVPPTREGLLHDVDVARLTGMRTALDRLFATDVTEGGNVRWQGTGQGAVLEVELPRAGQVAIVDLREDITQGQSVAKYLVEGLVSSGVWTALSEGSTIGYRKLDRINPTMVSRLRVTVDEAVAEVRPLVMKAWAPPA